MKRLTLFAIGLLFFIKIEARTDDSTHVHVVIDSIFLEGNKKTKAAYALRDLTFKSGDSIPLSILGKIIELNRLRLMNTNLFLNVTTNIKNWTSDNHVSIQFVVIENWFLYPIPIFELADRNFNVWWTEQKRSLQRLNYGLRLSYLNATGRRDPITAVAQFGYTPRYSLGYSIPFINKKQTIGLNFGFFDAVNREVGYKTEGNRLVFYRDSATNLLRRRSFDVGINYTPGNYDFHSFSMGYANNRLDPKIANERNPNYFLQSATNQRFFWLSYNYLFDKRDIRPYPISGSLLNFNISKLGLLGSDAVNLLDASLRFSKYTPLSTRWSLENTAKVKTALTRTQRPYNINRALGYGGDYVRGYELYVVDGLDFALSKNTLRFELFNKNVGKSEWVKWKALKNFLPVPIKTYLTGNFDMGIANDPFANRATNTFTNRLIYGGGFGLDVVIYYNIIWQFEYSFNATGERGFYFNYRIML